MPPPLLVVRVTPCASSCYFPASHLIISLANRVANSPLNHRYLRPSRKGLQRLHRLGPRNPRRRDWCLIRRLRGQSLCSRPQCYSRTSTVNLITTSSIQTEDQGTFSTERAKPEIYNDGFAHVGIREGMRLDGRETQANAYRDDRAQ
jgi:hypothetical protein